MRTAQDFIRRLLEVDPASRMTLTDALRHPWLDPSAESVSDASETSALARYNVDRSLSDVSELSELPEEDDHAGANGDVSMISAVPSSVNMLGVHALNINSPEIARIRRPLERRSKVLARELAAEAEVHPSPEADGGEPSGSASTPPTSNRNSGTGGKRRRPESSSGGGSPVDAAMGGESADSDSAGMDVDPQPPASKRGRRSQDKEQQTPAMPPTVKNDNGPGRVTRSKAAGPAGVQRR